MTTHNERDKAARVLHALAHPVRLGILEVLQEGEHNVTALYNKIGCTQSMMSQQLHVLEEQCIIATRKEGTTKFCRLRNPEVLNMMDCLRSHLYSYLRFRFQEDIAEEISNGET